MFIVYYIDTACFKQYFILFLLLLFLLTILLYNYSYLTNVLNHIIFTVYIILSYMIITMNIFNLMVNVDILYSSVHVTGICMQLQQVCSKASLMTSRLPTA